MGCSITSTLACSWERRRSILMHDHNLCAEELLATVSNRSSSSLDVDTQKFVYSEHRDTTVSSMYWLYCWIISSTSLSDTLSASLSCRITALHLFRFSSFTVALGSKNDKFRTRGNFSGDFSIIFFTIATKKIFAFLFELHYLFVIFHDFSWPLLFSMTFQAWKMVFLNSMTFHDQGHPAYTIYCANGF